MQHIKLIIFDLDGTLVDSLDNLAAAVNHVRKVFGLAQFTQCEVREILGSGQRLIDRAFPEAGPAELERAWTEYFSYCEDHLSASARIYPGVVDTLAELKKNGVLMAIFSSKHSNFSRKLLKSLGLDAYFSAILGPDSLPFRKPSPEPILKLLRDFHLEARESIIVGDGMNDILAGKNAGVITVGCSYGYGNASELTDADYHISSLPELLKLPLCDKLPHRAVEKAESTHHILKGLKT